MSKLLIEEPPLQVLPSLAVKIGLNEAIALQQLHWLLRDPNHGKMLDNKRWIFNTYEQWRVSYFPFWSEDTIKRVFTRLALLNLIATCQPEGRLSRRKYYSVNEGVMESLSERCKLPSSEGCNLPSSMSAECPDGNGANCPLPITKTSSKTSSKNTTNTRETEPSLFNTEIESTATKITPEQIYSEYPKKVGKKGAIRAIKTALREIGAADLLAKVKQYAIAVAVRDRQFIPYPATWFNDGRYFDDPKEWLQPAANTPAPAPKKETVDLDVLHDRRMAEKARKNNSQLLNQ